jgi:hypothetical protein
MDVFNPQKHHHEATNPGCLQEPKWQQTAWVGFTLWKTHLELENVNCLKNRVVLTIKVWIFVIPGSL